MNDVAFAQQLGVLQGQVASLSGTVERLEDSVRKLTSALDAAGGGWKMLAAVGGCAATLGAGGAWIASHFSWIHP